VVVAQSMGGLTAPLVAARIPVDLIVLLAAMVPVPGEAPTDLWGNTGLAEDRRILYEREGWGDPGEIDVVRDFLHDLPPSVLAEALARPERDQSWTPFEDPWPLDRWPEVPTRFLLARDDRFFPADHQRRVVPERLGIVPDEMPGGHCVALSQPVALADRLLRDLDEVRPPIGPGDVTSATGAS
jgi:pimeloyl-ACP methyl ester carboxylesterase